MKSAKIKNIKRRYLLSFFSLFFAFCFAQVVSQYFIYQQEDSSRMINLAGRQRMLSQKLSKLLLLKNSTKSSQFDQEITDTLEVLNSTHDNLLNGNSEEEIIAPLTKKIKSEYQKLSSILEQVNTQTSCLLSPCQDKTSALKGSLELLDSFLVKMNTIVFQSDQEVKFQVVWLGRVELALFFFAMFLLIFEFSKIVKPLESILNHQEDEIDQKTRLVHHNSKLASIGELSAGIGHEINNPLTIIKGHLGILSRKISPDQSEVKGIVDKIDRACDRIMTIVGGLRTFARDDHTKDSLFEVTHVIQECFDLVHDIYEQERVTVSYSPSLDSDQFLVMGNQGKIQQVLMNLITNAKDAIEDQDLRKITLKSEVVGENFAIIVQDNGPGIPEELIQKIFDPFFTTKEIGKGTGIGLSLANSIIQEHKGKLSVESHHNQGSTFTISLPIAKRRPSNLEKRENQEDQKVLAHTGTSKVHAMIVDDEEDICELLGDILEDLNVSSSAFPNGLEAYKAVSENPQKFDLIISDMKMPIMDGPSFLLKFRKLNMDNPPLFYFMTGGIRAEFQKKESELGSLIDGHFFKPFDHDKIQKVLDHLDQKQTKTAHSA